MKKVMLIGISLVMFQAGTAAAVTTCSQVGSATICTDTGGSQGGSVTTCRQVGSQVICS